MATRLDIRTRARIRADQDASTFPTDTQYNYLIDEAARETWYDLVQAGWPVAFSTIDKTATGTNPITIGGSGTLAFIRGVYLKEGTRYTDLQRLDEGQRASLMTAAQGPASHYSVLQDPTNGPVLELLPLPASGTYRVEYVVEHPGFAADATVWYGPGRSDELLVLRAAAKGLLKEGDKAGAQILEMEYARLLDKVQQMAGWFDLRNPPKIRDAGSAVFGVSSRDPFDYDV